ncbi:D-cysteine desulfhydrase (plasmid) [Fulvitalea axinellae]|uniref:D-cysteine desulfhydrase n=1 Tax=Fulvitalea axinellae TaxID=1182444 RepID=A0AAU9CRG4_9BACT|nr:D-cysteine desulfhydrase [Fulvitalea axinellae]
MIKTFEKVKLLNRETSLEFLPNLSRELGPDIYVKRDDEGGRGGGGNKLRKYERIIADAISKDCDTLIIAGHYQSNAARALIGVARQLNLRPVVVCKEMVPEQNPSFNENGNSLLMKLMAADIVSINKEDDFQTEMGKVARRLEAEGRKPYIIPFGGSNTLGSMGYVDCANEIQNQFENINNDGPDYVVTALGSGGTMAGLVAGFSNTKTKVVGFSVLHKDDTVNKIVEGLAGEILPKGSSLDYEINTDFVGEGYGFPTDKGIESIKLLAELEGLFLCPVYTGKAMAGLIDFTRSNRIRKGDTVVFVHTGGMPLVHGYYNRF